METSDTNTAEANEMKQGEMEVNEIKTEGIENAGAYRVFRGLVMAVSAIWVFLPLTLLIGLQGYPGDPTSAFHTYMAGIGILFITNVAVLYGTIKHFRPRRVLWIAVVGLLVFAGTATNFLHSWARLAGDSGSILTEVLSIILVSGASALLYIVMFVVKQHHYCRTSGK